MRKGFTLIELLVASILLAMLVTILTMFFNQSSIAWRTGTASIVNLNETREALGTFADIRDDILPNVGGAGSLNYRTTSIWKKSDANQLRSGSERAYSTEGIQWGQARSFSLNDAKTARQQSVTSGSGALSVSLFSVGVRSLGPDGKPDTEDDINTWPEEID